ncbi:MAG: cysteine desulfurase family protein [Ignavibacteria bacterium]|jgi:cysteine desulfurase
MKVYFDNAATTPMHPKVLESMIPYLSENFGNPSSIHSFGRKVRVAVEEAREIVADFINADPGEIYFVSGGTESNNFAIRGIAKTEYEESKRSKIVTSNTEHHCVIDTFEYLRQNGFDAEFLSSNKNSTVKTEELESAINSETSLVSVMHINNETGAVNDIELIGETASSGGTVFHCDAVQSFGKTNIDVKKIKIDSLSASGHKFYGPKGIGILYAKSGTPLSPILFGGSQERNRRGGTENIAGIIGFAEAVKIAQSELSENEKKVTKIKKEFVKGLQSLDNIYINSDGKTSPYILSLTFDSSYYNNDSESMLMYLDINGIAASNGAACTSGTLKPSHVILNSGHSIEDANGTIRFSFNPQNSIEEVNYILEVLYKMAKKFRK